MLLLLLLRYRLYVVAAPAAIGDDALALGWVHSRFHIQGRLNSNVCVSRSRFAQLKMFFFCSSARPLLYVCTEN